MPTGTSSPPRFEGPQDGFGHALGAQSAAFHELLNVAADSFGIVLADEARVVDDRRVHESRADDRHADRVRPELFTKCLRKSDEPVFGRAVRRELARREERRRGRDVDDLPAEPALDHRRHERATHERRSAQVHRERVIPIVGRRREEASDDDDTGGVDDGIGDSELRFDRRAKPFDGIGQRHVDDDGAHGASTPRPDFVRRAAKPRLVHVTEREPGAACCKRERRRSTDAARCARDDREAARNLPTPLARPARSCGVPRLKLQGRAGEAIFVRARAAPESVSLSRC